MVIYTATDTEGRILCEIARNKRRTISNDALLSRYKSAKDGGALISPQQPRISSSGQSSTGRLTLLDILSASVGCNTLHLASKVVCKGIPLDPF